jgi:hypothetical protein
VDILANDCFGRRDVRWTEEVRFKDLEAWVVQRSKRDMWLATITVNSIHFLNVSQWHGLVTWSWKVSST